MATPGTLADIIATIISRSKLTEICDTLHDVQNSTTEEELIEAGLPLAVYSYQAGIIDDTLLSSFTEGTLNSYGIYTTGTFTINNPTQEIYICKNAVVNITLSGATNQKINVMGAGKLNLTIGGTCYATVKVYDIAIATVTVNDNAMVNLSSRQVGTVTVIVNNNGIFHLSAYDLTAAVVTANDTSYSIAKMFNNSTITPGGISTLVINLYQAAQTILT